MTPSPRPGPASPSRPRPVPAHRGPGHLIPILVSAFVTSPLLATTDSAAAAAETVVAAAPVQRGDVWRDIVLNAEFQPYQEADLHAKVAGYVKSIGVDIGSVVREGDVIATLELPETEADIERAVSTVKRAEEEVRRAAAAHEDSLLGYNRIRTIHAKQPELVAQQDVDTASARERTAEATLAAARLQVDVARAELKKLQTLLGYARITAPFDGIVTRRYVSKGALIQAGTSSSTQAMPLVKLSQTSTLRLVVPVSLSAVPFVHRGDEVEIRMPGSADSTHLKVSRLAGKVDSATRTMDIEVDVPNPDYRLVPGAYVSVALKLDARPNVLTVPVEALSAQKRDTVYVINGGVVEDRHIELGLETPRKIEVRNGLREGEIVMIGSRASVKPGQHVKAQSTKPQTP